MIVIRSIIDYVETEMNTFEEKPFNSLDSLVLSQFSYIEFDGIIPDRRKASKPFYISNIFLAEHFSSMLKDTREPEKNKKLLTALTSSPRFRSIEMRYYVSEFDSVQEKQFSAVCYLLPEKLSYVAFRGTDNTIIGWKEDFNMAFKTPVPSQRSASEYLIFVAEKLGGRLLVGGHSKGGNLAVYAAMTAPPSVQERIVQVYDHDGPGFKDGVLDNDGYLRIKDKIQKTIPQSSLVGLLLDGHESYSVVESSRLGVMQHDPYSWKTSHDHFITTQQVSDSAQYINRTLRDWLDSLSDEQRERFVEILFDVLDAGKAETFTEITREWRKNFNAIFAAMKEVDPEMKAFIRQLIRDFGLQLMRNLRSKNNTQTPAGST